VLAALSGFALIASGCKSKEEKLYEMRATATARVDELYRDFGASEGVRAVVQGAEEIAREGDGAGLLADLSRTIGAAALEADRSDFELQCMTLGRGGHPVLLTPKGRAFFDRPDTRRRCADLALLRDGITKLEAQLGPPP
jgi:hypothetical protein